MGEVSSTGSSSTRNTLANTSSAAAEHFLWKDLSARFVIKIFVFPRSLDLRFQSERLFSSSPPSSSSSSSPSPPAVVAWWDRDRWNLGHVQDFLTHQLRIYFFFSVGLDCFTWASCPPPYPAHSHPPPHLPWGGERVAGVRGGGERGEER